VRAISLIGRICRARGRVYGESNYPDPANVPDSRFPRTLSASVATVTDGRNHRYIRLAANMNRSPQRANQGFVSVREIPRGNAERMASFRGINVPLPPCAEASAHAIALFRGATPLIQCYAENGP